MVTALSDGGALVCGVRNSPAPALKPLPGFIVRLNSSGKEVRRLDPGRPGFVGDPFYKTMTCAPWGDGYVMSAMEAADKGKAGGFDPFDNGIVTIRRLASDFSVIWSKPAAVGAFALPTAMAPRELASGELLFPSVGHIYLIAQDGRVIDEKAMGTCRPVRTQINHGETAFVCDDYSVAGTPEIVYYDAKLDIVKTQHVIGGSGLPIVSALPDGGFFATFGGPASAGPIVTLHDPAGHPVGTYIFPDGTLCDSIPNGDGVIVLRTVTGKGYPMPGISWIKN